MGTKGGKIGDRFEKQGVTFVPSQDFKGTDNGVDTIYFKKDKAVTLSQAAAERFVKAKKGSIKGEKAKEADKKADEGGEEGQGEDRLKALNAMKKDELIAISDGLGLDTEGLKKDEIIKAIAEAEGLGE